MNKDANPTLTTASGATLFFESGCLCHSVHSLLCTPLSDDELTLFAYVLQAELERRGIHDAEVVVDTQALDDMPLVELQYIQSKISSTIARRERASVGQMLLSLIEHGDELEGEESYPDYFPVGETDEGEIEGYYDDEPPASDFPF